MVYGKLWVKIDNTPIHKVIQNSGKHALPDPWFLHVVAIDQATYTWQADTYTD